MGGFVQVSDLIISCLERGRGGRGVRESSFLFARSFGWHFFPNASSSQVELNSGSHIKNSNHSFFALSLQTAEILESAPNISRQNP
jgi:hypothetical protein